MMETWRGVGGGFSSCCGCQTVRKETKNPNVMLCGRCRSALASTKQLQISCNKVLERLEFTGGQRRPLPFLPFLHLVPSRRARWLFKRLHAATPPPPPRDSVELTQSDRACRALCVCCVRACVSCCERVNVRLSQGDESSLSLSPVRC